MMSDSDNLHFHWAFLKLTFPNIMIYSSIIGYFYDLGSSVIFSSEETGSMFTDCEN